MKYDDG